MNQLHNSIKEKNNKHLTYTDRIIIETMIKDGKAKAEIALRIGRSIRTIQREFKRGKVVLKDALWRDIESYSADIAQSDYDYKATAKGCNLKIGNNIELIEFLAKDIRENNSSIEVALANAKEEKLDVNVCSKTIYNYINKGFIQITRDDLIVDQKKYKKQADRRHKKLKGTSIEERPDLINKREEIGHWEMDCVLGTRDRGKCLLVLTERVTSKEIIYLLENKTKENVLKALKNLRYKYKAKEFKNTFKSITVDNGSEFSDYYAIEKLGLKMYYCHPYSSYERGTNENQNKLIRRFSPKGKSMKSLTKNDVKKIEAWMNNYKRRRFDFKTPNQVFEEKYNELYVV